MAGTKHNKLTGKSLWVSAPTADRNLDLILGSVRNLPVNYWQNHFFFTGAKDKFLSELTNGKFPHTTRPGKTHPVFTLKALPGNSGYRVCPCSSRKPFNRQPYRYIKKGCLLEFTRHRMDRDSCLVENLILNLPPSVAIKLHFRGKVPYKCIISKTK